MTDYQNVARRPFLRRMMWRVVANKHINRVLVAALQRRPATDTIARLPVVGKSAAFALDDGRRVTMLEPDRCQVARELFWGQGALRKPADQLALKAAIALSVSADLFLDIGAYTGLFALSVAKSNPKVAAFAYEIVPENFLLLWRNVFANDLAGHVVPRILGLGDRDGAIQIPVSFGDGTLASSVALDAVESSGIQIPIARLDSEHAAFTGLAVMKIDVETFEWPVLLGGERFIARNRPDIICEVLRRAPHIAELQTFLAQMGYSIYHVTDGGLRQAQQIVPAVGERDWLFTTRTAAELKALGLTTLTA